MSGPWNGDAASGPVVTLDDREKLGPAEALLLEAADNRVAYHGTPADEVSATLLAQAREKLPEPELGTGPQADAAAQEAALAAADMGSDCELGGQDYSRSHFEVRSGSRLSACLAPRCWKLPEAGVADGAGVLVKPLARPVLTQWSSAAAR